MSRALSPLPIDEALPALIEALHIHGAAVLQAPPGAGKSTRVPGALLDAGVRPGRVVMLEPRRVAARAVAARIAEERGSPLGGEVGYAVRFDRKVSASTRIEIITEGLLLRRLQHDPLLEGVGCVVLDEFHERSVHTDLALAMLKEVRQVREDLALVVMSATIEAAPLEAYLEAPSVSSQGRIFPVQIEHRGGLQERLQGAILEEIASFADRDGEQDALVFLPGARSIHGAIAAITPLCARRGIEVRPLYGALSLQDQIAAITPVSSQRRVIVSTNIAETSLTVSGVTTVIDSGLVKQMRYDAQRGLDRLDVIKIARDSATQRAGRAGRVRPGRAIRLYSASDHDLRPAQTEPEIARVDLLAHLLEVVAWSGADPQRFDWFESPSPGALAAGVEALRALKLLEPHGFVLTPLGELARQLPAHPRLGVLIQSSRRLGVERLGLLAAALLSEGERPAPASSLSGAGTTLGCDLWAMTRAFERGEREMPRRVERVRGQLRARLEASSELPSPPPLRASSEVQEERFAQSVLSAYPDRICLRREGQGGHQQEDYVMVGGVPLTLARASVARGSEWLVATQIFGTRRVAREAAAAGLRERGLIRMATSIKRDWVEALYPERFSEQVEVRFDGERLRAEHHVSFDGLTLERRPASLKRHVAPQRQARALAEQVSLDLERAFRPDKEALQLMHRVTLLAVHRPDLSLPDLRPSALEERDEAAREAIISWCYGARGFDALRKRGFGACLKQSLSHAQRGALEELAPARMRVPSGSMIRLDYEGVLTSPVLAVRIQEVFGWTRTPTILGGQVEVVLHLLAPNYRPAQVTRDLHSFWENTYPEVRKELRARYPKHAWPQDPWSAQAVKKGASAKR